MSLNGMVDAKLAREQGQNSQKPSLPSPVGVETGVINQLTRWIPTESITIYVALLGLFGTMTIKDGQSLADLDYTARWGLMLGVAVATPFIVVLLTMAKSDEFKWPVFEMVVGTGAFAAWAVALPETPLNDFSGYDVKFNGAILLVVTLLITLVANALKKSPRLDQSQTVQAGADAASPKPAA